MPGPLAVHQVGHGPAVVWLHGYTMDSSLWTELWGLLPGYRHIGVDLLGHGASPGYELGTSLADLTSGVVEVLRESRAHALVALSMGTIVAFDTIIGGHYPLARLVVAAPALSGMMPAPGTAQRYRELLALRMIGGSGDDLAALWMRSPPDIFAGTERHPDLRGRVRSVISRHAWCELDQGGPTALFESYQRVEDLPGSAERMLVIGGDDDMPTFSALGRKIATCVPGTEAVTLPKAGHLCLLEVPRPAASAIRGFLAD